MKTPIKLILSVFLILLLGFSPYSQDLTHGEAAFRCEINFAENSVRFVIYPKVTEDGIVKILDKEESLVYVDSMLYRADKEYYTFEFSRDDFSDDEYYLQCTFGENTCTYKADVGSLWQQALESPVERQELSRFAVRTFYGGFEDCEADFTDSENISYEKETGFLQSKNILLGYEDGSFRGANKLTKAECVAIMCRIYRDRTGARLVSSQEGISLAVNIPEWAKDEFAFAKEKGIITEKEVVEWNGNEPASAELVCRLSMKIKEASVN